MATKLPTAISFSGCGFLGIYHIGLARCFQIYGPKILENTTKYAGASAGSLAAIVMAVCPDKLLLCKKITHNIATEARKFRLGPLNSKFNLAERVENMIDSVLPEDAHVKAKGRVYISVTRKKCGKNFLITDFCSRADLIQCLVSSCHIPVYSGKKLPLFRGEKYYDGGFTDNLVNFEDEVTLFVTPFSGGLSYICPNDPIKKYNVTISNQNFCVNLRNLSRGIDALFPPAPKILDRYYEQGFIDGLRYLAKLSETNPELVSLQTRHPRLSQRLMSSAMQCRVRSSIPDPDSAPYSPSEELRQHGLEEDPKTSSEIAAKQKEEIKQRDEISYKD